MLAGWLDLTTPLFAVIRVIVGLGGVFVGYFFSGPFLRLTWWLIKRKPIPPRLLPWAKVGVGLLLGALLYFFLPLGGGGGWGTGGPGGGGTGTGKGTGAGKGPGIDSAGTPTQVVPNDVKPGPGTVARSRTVLFIEMLGGDRYPGEGKFYLVNRQDPPVALAQVRDVLKKNSEKLEVHLVFTPTSVGLRHSAADRLRELAQELRIPLLEVLEGEKAEKAGVR